MLAAYGDIAVWDTSKVTNMNNVFGLYITQRITMSLGLITQWITAHLLLMIGGSIHYLVHIGHTPSTMIYQNGKPVKLHRWIKCFIVHSPLTVIYPSGILVKFHRWILIMFYSASSLIMFYSASSLSQILCWKTTKVMNETNMFTRSRGSFASTPYPICLMPSMMPSKHPTRIP